MNQISPSLKTYFSLAALLLTLSATANAQEQQFARHNCAITPPKGWQVLDSMMSKPGMLAAYIKDDRTRLVLLLVDDRSPVPGPLDDRFVTEFDRGVKSSGGGERISGKFIQVGGIKAYERIGTAMANGQRASILMQALAADGKFFSLQGLSFTSDANDDPEIRAWMNSFRFLKPAAPPAPGLSGKSSAYRIGYVMGKYSVYLAVGVAVIAGIAIFLRQQHRSR